MFDPEDISIEEWFQTHPCWSQLMDVVAEQGQDSWVTFSAAWHHSSHILVAHRTGAILGFLRYVVQDIGPDSDCPPVCLGSQTLREAKVLAFAVRERYRHQGIGRALQEHLIAAAKAAGLFQIRSHSSGDNAANHQLKLALGYGVHPIVRGEDRRGVYFILPLQVSTLVTRKQQS